MSAAHTPTRSVWPWHLAAFGAYVALVVVLTWPLTINLTTAVPNDLVDPLLNAWIIWWNTQAIPFTTAWWNAPLFFPLEGGLTFSEHLAGLSPLSTPIYWLTGHVQLTYNLTFLLTFPLSAMAAYALGLELTGGRRDAAFLAGLIYGFAPYRVPQMAHLQVLISFWMPLALLGLHQYLRRGSWRGLALFGTAWLLQGLSNGYFLAYFSIIAGLWVLWFVRWQEWRRAVPIASVLAVAAIPVLFVVATYRAVHERYALSRELTEIREFGADLTSLLNAADRLTFWHGIRVYADPEGELFTGLGVLLIIAGGLWCARRSWAATRPVPQRLRWTLIGGAAFFGAVAVSAMVSPWTLSLGFLTVSSNRPDKPFTLAVVLLAALALMSRPVRHALRTRSALAFYTLAAVLAWVFALGPAPTWFGEQVFYEPPYAWLLRLPGFDSLRVPARFGMVMMLCLSAAAAVAYPHLAPRRWPRSKRLALASLFAVVITGDTWISRMPLETAPPVWDIAHDEIQGAALVLPLGSPEADVRAMYQGMGHGQPVVNGYSGNFAPWYYALQHGLETRNPEILDDLSRLGVTQIVVSDFFDREDSWHAYALTRATLKREGEDGTYRLFDLPPATPLPPAPEYGDPIEPAAITTTVKMELLPLLTDGDLRTRWESGPQYGTEVLQIDLGAPQPVAAVRLLLGPFVADYPRDLTVAVSDDGTDWTDVWSGPTVTMAVRAGLFDPGGAPLVFDLGGRTTRFIRLSQTVDDGTWYWSVAELEVNASRR